MQVEYALTFALLAFHFWVDNDIRTDIVYYSAGDSRLGSKPVFTLEVGILYVIIQQFENHLISSAGGRKIVGVPSIMVILALVIGAQIGGIFLLCFLAIPLATVVIEVLDDLNYRKDRRSKNQ